jgi:small conductance mechanosensitive channel
MTYDYQKDIDAITVILKDYAPKLATAIILLLIGLWLVKKINRLFDKILTKKGVDYSLRTFLGSLVSISLKLLVLVTVLSQAGVKTTSFVAVLGTAGLAIGMAMQGALANFAGGAMIMLFKPFRVGDLIKAQGEVGEVKEIEILTTKLIVAGNKTAIIPNGVLANDKIINYNQGGKLRVDLEIGISYDSNIKEARNVLLAVMNAHPAILEDPKPTVHVASLGDSAVVLLLRPWTTPSRYWEMYYEILENGKEALDQANISIPFPQRDVHIYEHGKG